jgi:probable O-glycosylation ligase (exosortase A-associated)
MRDLVVTLMVFGSLPFILKRPWIGVLVWSWLSYMNPHRLAFGFAYSFPFAQVVALTTFAGILFYREKKSIPWTSVTFCWVLFVFWMNVTTYYAVHPADAFPEWDRAMKIQVIVLVTLMLIKDRPRVDALVWTIVLSLGFFGARGGVFSVLTGAQYQVLGPPESFITDNNTLGLALIMTMPLMRYLQLNASRKWLRVGIGTLGGLTALAVLTSHSRGAFLAAAVMIVFLVMKSRNKLRFAFLVVAAVPVMLLLMPDSWYERMGSISEYQSDASAMGRINAWHMAFNLALDRPVVGAGFQAFLPDMFERYAPNPEDIHDAHSIYFEVLAEHGFVGLALFLGIGWFAFRTGSRVIKQVAGHESLTWARDLASMLQVSIIGYAVGGAFLGLAYFDLFYHLVVILIILSKIVETELAELAPKKPQAATAARQAVQQPAWRRVTPNARGARR